jgi:tetratricopeptide (TPR) repeat protein
MGRLLGWMVAATVAATGHALAADTAKDAMGKVGSAMSYLDKLGRPVPAEEDLKDAEAICKALHDDDCLGQVWRAWGYYFRSDALTRWKGAKVYGPALYDPKVKFEQRYERSIEYYDMALQLYEKLGNPHWIAHLELQKAYAYNAMNRHEQACRSLQASREADAKYENGNAHGPQGKTFAEFIDELDRAGHCPSQPSAATPQ